MKTLFRKTLRSILKYLCIIAINKHQLEIITVGGWYGTDIAREAVYTILKSNGKKVRRIIKSPQVDWDIPLSILGIRSLPANVFSWIYEIIHASLQLLILKPNPSILVLQINAQDPGIMKYWMSFLNPQVVIMLNSHVGTLNLELLLVEKLRENGMLVLNNDNIRTKSLAQGRKKNVYYFGEANPHANPDFFYMISRDAKNEFLKIGTGETLCSVNKGFPEFAFPFLTAATAISTYYDLAFSDACLSLNYFELPSDKIQKIFHKFIED